MFKPLGQPPLSLQATKGRSCSSHSRPLVPGRRRLIPLFSPRQAASPACTELETVMMDWLGKMLKLPEAFLAGQVGEGGGVIQVRWGGAVRLSGVQGLHTRAYRWEKGGL